MKTWMVVAAATVLHLPAARGQEEPDKVHVRIARKVAPAVVYVEGDSQQGSGVIIDPSGIILTSPTACGDDSKVVTVLTRGNRRHTGRVLGRANHQELVLLKIDAGQKLPFVELGDSEAARPGQVAYVFGDSFGSIRSDDQPAMSLGVISGIYDCTQTQKNALYQGKVLETSAAVNPQQDGGPLVDREGRLLGIITLNYVDSKFTGLAIPIAVHKPLIERIRREHVSSPVVIEAPAKPKPAAAASRDDTWLGLEVKAGPEGLEVVRVSRKSPAELAGLKKGDVVVALDGVPPADEPALRKAIAQKGPGDAVRITVNREDGSRAQITVTLAARPVY